MVVSDASLASTAAKPAPATRPSAARPAQALVAPLITLGTPLGRWSRLAGNLFARAADGIDLRQRGFCDWHSSRLGETAGRLIPFDDSAPTSAQQLSLQALWPEPPQLAGGMDERACWTLETLRQALPQARFLILVESPVAALSTWMQAAADGRIGDALSFWHAGAQRLLAHVQRCPDRCLVISADEAANAPVAFAERIAEWLDVKWTAGSADVDTAAEDDAIALALAEAAVRSHPATAALFQHLHACCVPLTDGGADILGIDAFVRPDIDAAVQNLASSRLRVEQLRAEVTQLRSEFDQLREELEAAVATAQELAEARTESAMLQQQLDQTKERLEVAEATCQQAIGASATAASELAEALTESAMQQQLLDQAKKRLEAAEATCQQAVDASSSAASELAEARAESEMLLLQLHQVQEELETTFIARQQANEQSGALQKELEQAKQALDATVSARQGAEEHASALERRLTELQNNPPQSAELAEARQEAELLLLQLHQVQEELEHYYLEWRKLQEQPRAAAPAKSAAFTIGKLQIDGERDTQPHRELSLTLGNLMIGERSFASLQLRLVEHLGRPGIAIFAPPGEARPLSAWEDSGSESGRPFLLFVPSDPNSRALWQRLPRTDWSFLAALPPLIEQTIADHATDVYAGWVQVARRLAHQFDELPARLRYDALDVSTDAAGFGIRFGAVQFGSRQLDHVELRWQPGRSVELLLSTDPNVPPPLSNWPLAEDGSRPSSWCIPVGRELSGQDKARRWSELSPGDRAFVLALLDALPAGPARLDPAILAGGADARQRLIKHAAAPLRSALDTMQGGRLRRILRRVANVPLMPC
jgi:hypothetical protein